MNRTTKWRLKTGRSKTHTPKGPVCYRAVALAICRKHFRHLIEMHREDAFQECVLLEQEAETRKRIRVNGRIFGHGNQDSRMGLKSFSRAVYARLYDMSVRYGYFRPKGYKYFIPRQAWNWGLKEDWIHDMPPFGNPEELIVEIRKNVPADLWEKAIGGDQTATARLRAIIWGE